VRHVQIPAAPFLPNPCFQDELSLIWDKIMLDLKRNWSRSKLANFLPADIILRMFLRDILAYNTRNQQEQKKSDCA
jgi:hypothetical protein